MIGAEQQALRGRSIATRAIIEASPTVAIFSIYGALSKLATFFPIAMPTLPKRGVFASLRLKYRPRW
jgi:hypothetical protein